MGLVTLFLLPAASRSRNNDPLHYPQFCYGGRTEQVCDMPEGDEKATAMPFF